MQLHTLKTADTGLSRMLLWWMWKMGAAAVNDVFYPADAQAAAGSLAQGLGALKSLFRSECLLAHLNTSVLHWAATFCLHAFCLNTGQHEA